MNCNFLETEYFYHNHLSGQGESESDTCDQGDPLRWFVPSPLPSQSHVEPSEKVSVAADHVSPTSETLVHAPPPSDPPEMMSEVNPDPNSDIMGPPNNPIQEDEEVTAIDGDTGRYVLPPRSTRGVPPKRYSPERINQKSRYSMANLARSSLTEMARAFEAALYEEEEIPQTAVEAWKIKHWRDAMLVEMKALKKNNTWEKCQLPEEGRTVGCRWVFTIKRRPDGSIERYKARLVAKGYIQTMGSTMQKPSLQLLR